MIFQKGKEEVVSDHFKSTDFDCACKHPECKETTINPNLLLSLEELWNLCGEYKISSGFRCEKRNTELGGVKNSRHLTGQAADIYSEKGYSGPELAKFANEIGRFKMGGMGIAETWIHLDIRPNIARWTYQTTN